MSTPRRKIHTDADLRTGSDYLEYHVRMYAETLRWLRDKSAIGETTGPEWNAMLEDHLVHARLLINFVSNVRGRDDDVIAIDYFHDAPHLYSPINDSFLQGAVDRIGGNLVHITTKPMPALKSQQKWEIDEISMKLVPALYNFLMVVPEVRLADGVRTDCMNHLSNLIPPTPTLSASPST